MHKSQSSYRKRRASRNELNSAIRKRARLQHVLEGMKSSTIREYFISRYTPEGAYKNNYAHADKYGIKDKGDWFLRFCYDTLYPSTMSAIGSILKYRQSYSVEDDPESINKLLRGWADLGHGLESDLQQAKKVIHDVLQGNIALKTRKRVIYLEKLWQLMQQVSMLENGCSILGKFINGDTDDNPYPWGGKELRACQDTVLDCVASFIAIRNAKFPLKKLLLKKGDFHKSTVCEVMIRQIFGQAISRPK